MPKTTPRVETPAPAKPANGKPKKKAATAERPVVYPYYEAVWHIDKPETVKPGQPVAGPITATLAREWLGWEAETDNGPKFGNDYLFTDRYGKKIRCHKDVRNRPLYTSRVEELIQEILRRRWETNGETVIIGRTGIVLNGQHQLISVVLADQDRQRHSRVWGEAWPAECHVTKLVAFGVEETDEVVNTMDTCKPRSLADVIYRSPFFAKLDSANRRTAAEITDHAVRSMWKRTGVGVGAFSLTRTHPEAIDFVNRHPRLLKCVKEVMEANSRNGIRLYLGLGYAAAACYLMGSDATNPDDYYGPEDHHEKPLVWDNWERACAFWAEFAKPIREKEIDGKTVEASQINCLHNAVVKLTHPDGTPGSQAEKDYLVCQAWAAWKRKGKVVPKDLGVRYSQPDAKGRRHIIDAPTIGGIDLGLTFTQPPPSDEPSPEEQQQNGELAAEISHEAINGHELADDGETDWSWLDKLHVDNPNCGPILCKNALGKWVAWGIDGAMVVRETGLAARMHPKGVECVTVANEDLDAVVRDLNKAGVRVGLAEEDGRGNWEVKTIRVPTTKR